MRLASGHSGAWLLVNAQARTDLAVIALALGASGVLRNREVTAGYRLAAYLALVGWLWRAISYFPQGQSYVMVAWAVLAAGLLVHSWRSRAVAIAERVAAHVAFGAAGLVLVISLASGHERGLAVLNLTGLLDLAVILLAATVSVLWATREEVLVYRLTADVALLLWTWRELAVLPNGNVYVTIAWAGYAIALLVVAIRRQRDRLLLYGALATLGLVVTKLFLVDLSAVDTIWRIMLFLGVGGLFLVVSYYFQNLLRPAPGAVGAAAAGEDRVAGGAPAADEVLPEPALIPAAAAPPLF